MTCIVVMGVAGSGKTTVGRELARRLNWRFCDADDLHDADAVDRIRRGEALDDEARAPWLGRVRRVIEDAVSDADPVVVACSALKARYRAALAEGLPGVEFVFLRADRPLLRQRLQQRAGHFAGPELLASQLAALEPPPPATEVDASLPVATIVDTLLVRFAAPGREHQDLSDD